MSEIDDFMEGLNELSRRTGIVVGACGECDSPWVGPASAVTEENYYWRDQAILVDLTWEGDKYSSSPNDRNTQNPSAEPR